MERADDCFQSLRNFSELSRFGIAVAHGLLKSTEGLSTGLSPRPSKRAMNQKSRAKIPQLQGVNRLRYFLLGILVLGLLGTGIELLLLDHMEEFVQWAPLLLIALCLATIAWHLLAGGQASLRLMQALMLACIVAGFAGMYFHYQGSAEFKLESNRSLTGWDLFWAALRSKAPPSLAPGVMIQLGLIGLAFCYRHPLFDGEPAKEKS